MDSSLGPGEGEETLEDSVDSESGVTSEAIVACDTTGGPRWKDECKKLERQHQVLQVTDTTVFSAGCGSRVAVNLAGNMSRYAASNNLFAYMETTSQQAQAASAQIENLPPAIAERFKENAKAVAKNDTPKPVGVARMALNGLVSGALSGVAMAGLSEVYKQKKFHQESFLSLFPPHFRDALCGGGRQRVAETIAGFLGKRSIHWLTVARRASCGAAVGGGVGCAVGVVGAEVSQLISSGTASLYQSGHTQAAQALQGVANSLGFVAVGAIFACEVGYGIYRVKTGAICARACGRLATGAGVRAALNAGAYGLSFIPVCGVPVAIVAGVVINLADFTTGFSDKLAEFCVPVNEAEAVFNFKKLHAEMVSRAKQMLKISDETARCEQKLRQEFRRWMRQLHPDKHGGKEHEHLHTVMGAFSLLILEARGQPMKAPEMLALVDDAQVDRTRVVYQPQHEKVHELPTKGRKYFLINESTGQLLDSADERDGHVKPWAGGPSLQWAPESTKWVFAEGSFVVNSSTGQCLDSTGVHNAKVRLSDRESVADLNHLRWAPTPQGTLVNFSTGQLLDSTGRRGAEVQVSSCHDEHDVHDMQWEFKLAESDQPWTVWMDVGKGCKAQRFAFETYEDAKRAMTSLRWHGAMLLNPFGHVVIENCSTAGAVRRIRRTLPPVDWSVRPSVGSWFSPPRRKIDCDALKSG